MYENVYEDMFTGSNMHRNSKVQPYIGAPSITGVSHNSMHIQSAIGVKPTMESPRYAGESPSATMKVQTNMGGISPIMGVSHARQDSTTQKVPSVAWDASLVR